MDRLPFLPAFDTASGAGFAAAGPSTLLECLKEVLTCDSSDGLERTGTQTGMSVLPDPAGPLANHRLSHAAGERLTELRHVRHYAIDAVLVGRVRIGDGAQALVLGTLVAAGPLRHSDEEALVGAEAIHRFQILTPGGVFPRQVREEGSAEIRDVLAQRQLAVDFDVIHDSVLGILIGNAFGALLELGGVVFGPPIFQISLRIELTALIVEAVGELVPDGGAGVTVIRRIVHFRIEQRRLQNAG